MMKFIKNPNLPESKVSLIVLGRIPDEYLKILRERNIEILFSRNNLFIDSAVKNHADMCAVHLGDNKVSVDKGQAELIRQLKERGFEVVETAEKIKGEYPHDIKLNVALFGEYSVGAFKYSDKNFLDSTQKFKRVSVRQGYSKCSILPVSESAVITDDESVYNSLKNHVDVLLISKGDIALAGHEYGFIGGASAKISNDEVFFFGNIEAHRNYNEIHEFLKKHGCTMIYDKNLLLTDFGGLVTLVEFNN